MAEAAKDSEANGRKVDETVNGLEAAPATAAGKAAAAMVTKAVIEREGVVSQTAAPLIESKEAGKQSSEGNSAGKIAVSEQTLPVRAEAKANEVRNESGLKRDGGEAGGRLDALVIYEGDKQDAAERKEERKGDQGMAEVQQPVVKKKLGRPKKIREQEAVKGELKTPALETNRGPGQKKRPLTPLYERERPSRERKLIERFVASVEKGKKELVIKQGTGTTLNDIPNVYFKLGKKAKGDETLSILHSVLYSKRAKANAIKNNILQFSGYVWTENEEKERRKVREKLEKYTKESLIQIVDVLDIHLNKTGKKDEIIAKVLEFLEAPHKTTDVCFQEKEQRAKEKKRTITTPRRGRVRKRPKLGESSSTTRRGRRNRSNDMGMRGDHGNHEDESLEEEEVGRRLTFIDDHEIEDENHKDKETKQRFRRRVPKALKEETKELAEDKESKEGSEGDEAVKQTLSKHMSSPDITSSLFKSAEKVYTKRSSKKVKEEAKGGGKLKSLTREIGMGRSSGRGKKIGKAKDQKEPLAKKKKTVEIPSDELLQHKIRDLLKDLSQDDFSRVTYMDIVVQLEDIFNTELSVKKGHVKLLIRQELSRLAEEVGEDEDELGVPGVGVQCEEMADRQGAERPSEGGPNFNAGSKATITTAEIVMEPKAQKEHSQATTFLQAAGDSNSKRY